MCFSVCVCLCERERESECVLVCVSVFVCYIETSMSRSGQKVGCCATAKERYNSCGNWIPDFSVLSRVLLFVRNWNRKDPRAPEQQIPTSH